jgi:hypothetical protein
MRWVAAKDSMQSTRSAVFHASEKSASQLSALQGPARWKRKQKRGVRINKIENTEKGQGRVEERGGVLQIKRK